LNDSINVAEGGSTGGKTRCGLGKKKRRDGRPGGCSHIRPVSERGGFKQKKGYKTGWSFGDIHAYWKGEGGEKEGRKPQTQFLEWDT